MTTPPKVSHQNDGHCLKCRQIIGKFPGFYQPLALWFFAFQKDHPETHCSEAGRDEDTQESFFKRKASLAHWTESAHNWNCALDLFVMIKGDPRLYPPEWFDKVLKPNLPPWIEWAGEWKKFRELPHVQIRDWKKLVTTGQLKLVGLRD